jgi:hypothetical protein
MDDKKVVQPGESSATGVEPEQEPWSTGVDAQESLYEVDPFVVGRPRFQTPSLSITTGLDVQEEIYEREEMHLPQDEPEIRRFAPLMSNLPPRI